MPQTNDILKQLLEKDLTPIAAQVDRDLLDALAVSHEAWRQEHQTDRSGSDIRETARNLAAFLLARIEETVEDITARHVRHAEFSRRYAHAATEAERRQHILDYARDMGADARQLRGDQRAFTRWLGQDTMVDRHARRLASAERYIAFCLHRLGVATACTLEHTATDEALGAGLVSAWRSLGIEPIIRRLLAYDGDSRVCIEAFRCLATAIRALPPDVQETCIEQATLQYIFRSALESRQDVWIQCEALHLLQVVASSSLEIALEKRLRKPREGDDLFVRRQAVVLLGRNLARIPSLTKLIAVAVTDPSPHVRQAVASTLREAPFDETYPHWRQLTIDDPVAEVRAATMVELGAAAVSQPDLFETALKLLVVALGKEQDAFVLRTACHVATETSLALQAEVQEENSARAVQWHETLSVEIERLHQEADALSVRRWAAQARERMWCAHDAQAEELRIALSHALHRIRPGAAGYVPKRLFRQAEREMLERVLAVICQNDYGLDIEEGLWRIRVTRGHRRGFRLWRFLHEVRHAAPAKRQGFRHTIGRIFSGRLHVPSGILAELSETKVPGEPLHVESEAGWRPYLPLPDAVLGSLDAASHRKPLRIVTSEGVTEVKPPRFTLRGIWARTWLTMRFAHYARMRNWEEESAHSPRAYLRALRRLGFRVGFLSHDSAVDQSQEDPAVRRFFPAFVPLFDRDLWPRMKLYFVSVYENSLFELAIFAVGTALLFFARNYYTSRVLRKTRTAFALVIGGWGTRGKSGTERLKAAMLNACGYGIFSKTTGCEPTFLHAHPFGPLREVLLFRPYEKASIWEQYTVFRLAKRLGAKVFLWECMALTPEFVRILQRQWMRDDIATITNTFPDHEDLQGPAGTDVVDVMTNFIPDRSTLITSEVQMLPVLAKAAASRNTELHAVDWLDAGLTAPDILARFPYEEHPCNVALAAAVGAKLGIPRDFALKEMADRVCPDIGVLKAYPPADVNGRRLEFVNGMSANERYGCMTNWRRMGFANSDPVENPGIWISALINNRADRVARSRVFAQILAHDITADAFYLIGDNLSGFMGYVTEAWKEFASDITLWPEISEEQDAVQPDPVQAALALAHRFRMPGSGTEIQSRLKAMIDGLAAEADGEALSAIWEDPDALADGLRAAGLERYCEDILVHVGRWNDVLREYEELMVRVASAERRKRSLDEAFRKLLWRWFEQKFVVIPDVHVPGDKVIDSIACATPPGLHSRIMGMQNIKGAGLNFVFCWQAWERCHRACTLLRSIHPTEIRQGLQILEGFQEYGLLCEAYVQNTVEEVSHRPLAQTERIQAELTLVRSNLQRAMRDVRARLKLVRQTGWLPRFLGAVEAFMDAGDAVRRRKLSDRIYKDLVNERVSYDRATRELQAIQNREKGGWLLASLSRLRKRISDEGA